jgi:hypothetical protein
MLLPDARLSRRKQNADAIILQIPSSMCPTTDKKKKPTTGLPSGK